VAWKRNESNDRVQLQLINEILVHDPIDLQKLRSVCSRGLPSHKIRRKVWPRLLGVDPLKISYYSRINKTHQETEQVARDVERSLWRMITDSELREKKRKELSDIINTILARYDHLYYFQGFHDVCSVFLVVCDEKLAFGLLEKLSLYHIRDHLSSDLEPITLQLQLLFPLIKLMDKETHRFIMNSNVQPLFALSWVLTWFSHVIDDVPLISRLFDFFLASHPLMSLYLSAAIVVHRKNGLIKCPCEYSAVHNYLSRTPHMELPFEELLEVASKTFVKYPPNKLDNFDLFAPKSIVKDYPFSWMKAPQHPYQKRETEKKTKNIEQILFYSIIIPLSIFVLYLFFPHLFPNNEPRM